MCAAAIAGRLRRYEHPLRMHRTRTVAHAGTLVTDKRRTSVWSRATCHPARTPEPIGPRIVTVICPTLLDELR